MGTICFTHSTKLRIWQRHSKIPPQCCLPCKSVSLTQVHWWAIYIQVNIMIIYEYTHTHDICHNNDNNGKPWYFSLKQLLPLAIGNRVFIGSMAVHPTNSNIKWLCVTASCSDNASFDNGQMCTLWSQRQPWSNFYKMIEWTRSWKRKMKKCKDKKMKVL